MSRYDRVIICGDVFELVGSLGTSASECVDNFGVVRGVVFVGGGTMLVVVLVFGFGLRGRFKSFEVDTPVAKEEEDDGSVSNESWHWFEGENG